MNTTDAEEWSACRLHADQPDETALPVGRSVQRSDGDGFVELGGAPLVAMMQSHQLVGYRDYTSESTIQLNWPRRIFI